MGAIRSKTCQRGHRFTIRGDRQVCLICERERVRAYRRRKKSKKSR